MKRMLVPEIERLEITAGWVLLTIFSHLLHCNRQRIPFHEGTVFEYFMQCCINDLCALITILHLPFEQLHSSGL